MLCKFHQFWRFLFLHWLMELFNRNNARCVWKQSCLSCSQLRFCCCFGCCDCWLSVQIKAGDGACVVHLCCTFCNSGCRFWPMPNSTRSTGARHRFQSALHANHGVCSHLHIVNHDHRWCCTIVRRWFLSLAVLAWSVSCFRFLCFLLCVPAFIAHMWCVVCGADPRVTSANPQPALADGSIWTPQIEFKNILNPLIEVVPHYYSLNTDIASWVDPDLLGASANETYMEYDARWSGRHKFVLFIVVWVAFHLFIIVVCCSCV